MVFCDFIVLALVLFLLLENWSLDGEGEHEEDSVDLERSEPHIFAAFNSSSNL